MIELFLTLVTLVPLVALVPREAHVGEATDLVPAPSPIVRERRHQQGLARSAEALVSVLELALGLHLDAKPFGRAHQAGPCEGPGPGALALGAGQGLEGIPEGFEQGSFPGHVSPLGRSLP